MCIFAPRSSAFLQADNAAMTCKDARMGDADQEQARRLIRAALRETGLLPTQLARLAGVSHTTLTRFLNNPDVTHVTSTRTLNKIMAAVTRLRLAKAAASEPLPLPPPRPKPRTPTAPASKRGLR
jgi:lambda repressor-like predicted transcriptional regulator